MTTAIHVNHHMRRLRRAWALGAVLHCASAAVEANLIVNGSFEESASDHSGWRWHSAADVPGWHGDNIEIWDRFGAIGAYDGNRHAELNAHPGDGTPFTIYQDIATTAGSNYQLSFAYGARRSGREAFLVEFAGQAFLIDDHRVNRWSFFEETITAHAASTRLSFTTVTPSTGTVGNFLDAIRVDNAISTVDAPAGISLLSSGLLCLLFITSRRRPQST